MEMCHEIHAQDALARDSRVSGAAARVRLQSNRLMEHAQREERESLMRWQLEHNERQNSIWSTECLM